MHCRHQVLVGRGAIGPNLVILAIGSAVSVGVVALKHRIGSVLNVEHLSSDAPVMRLLGRNLSAEEMSPVIRVIVNMI